MKIELAEPTATARITLTKGLSALVDESDFEWLAQWKWTAVIKQNGIYAYRKSETDRKTVYMHRAILAAPEGAEVDHANLYGLDNRRQNLRLATSSQNKANRAKAHGVSRFKGVVWHAQRNKWMAQTKAAGKRYYLGLFVDEAEAAVAYDLKAVELFGPFARLNFPVTERAS